MARPQLPDQEHVLPVRRVNTDTQWLKAGKDGFQACGVEWMDEPAKYSP
jgi:hypothetical protein